MKGFIIRQPWADLIFDGLKSWEIRGSNCKIRGTVGIVCQGQWIGTVEITNCKELTMDQYSKNKSKHQVQDTSESPYKKTFAWVLSNPKRFKVPKKYIHKNGCVIWVNL